MSFRIEHWEKIFGPKSGSRNQLFSFWRFRHFWHSLFYCIFLLKALPKLIEILPEFCHCYDTLFGVWKFFLVTCLGPQEQKPSFWRKFSKILTFWFWFFVPSSGFLWNKKYTWILSFECPFGWSTKKNFLICLLPAIWTILIFLDSRLIFWP